MKRYVVVVWLMLCVSAGYAATPVGPLNYQGRLLDNASIPVSGNYNFVVKIYNDPVAGTLKYQETINAVAVNDGVYAFKIGLGPKTGGDSLWDINLWQLNLNDLYLEVAVNGETLTPRHELTSAPHAFTATLALSAESLGARTAAEFDNILEGVCVGNSGKWLQTAQRCAGGAVDFSTALWSNLDASNNYSGVVFTNANFTNANFSGVNFSNAVFKNVNMQGANFANANFSGATWDGVYWGNTAPNINGSNLSSVKFSNLNLSVVSPNFSTSTVTGASIAKLSNCPPGASLPAGWTCDGGPLGFNLAGNTANFSANSAALVSRYGTDKFLSVQHVENNLANTDFSGVFMSTSFLDGLLHDATFEYSQLYKSDFTFSQLVRTNFRDSIISWTDFNTCDLQDTDFSSANLRNVTFTDCAVNSASATWGILLDNAKLDKVYFTGLNGSNTSHSGEASKINFGCVAMDGVSFENSNLTGAYSNCSGMIHRNMVFRNITLNAGSTLQLTGHNFKDSIFSGVAAGAGVSIQLGGLDTVDFKSISGNPNLRLFGDINQTTLTSMNLTGSSLYSRTLDTAYFTSCTMNGVNISFATLRNTDFSSSNLSNANFSSSNLSTVNFSNANLTGANFSGSSRAGITWTGATCPNGLPASMGVPGCEDQL